MGILDGIVEWVAEQIMNGLDHWRRKSRLEAAGIQLQFKPFTRLKKEQIGILTEPSDRDFFFPSSH